MLDGIHNATLIFNPAAGRLRHRGAEHLQQVLRILREAGIETELRATDAPGSATTLAHAAVKHGRQLILVCGGDGTLNEVVNGVAGTIVPLGLLPAGTANVLAKELGLSWSIPRAAQQLVRGRLRRIALGQAIPEGPRQPAAPDGAPRYFITLAGAGVDADMVRRVHDSIKKHTGILAYWVAGIQQLTEYRYPLFRARSAENEISAAFLCVGRTKAHGFPVNITTGASLFEDRFEMAAFTYRNSWALLASGLVALVGRLRRSRSAHFWKATELHVEPVNGARILYQVDGELIGPLPVTFRIVPDALTLVVPGAPSGS
jgi:YegS/Rv2252/BmrU family lipid kinase